MSGGGLVKRIAVTLWGILAVLCGGLLLQRWETSENFRPTATDFRQNLPVLGVYNDTETAEKEGVGVVVYLDVLIAVNWLVDYLLLRGCARLTSLHGSNGRLVLGGLIGGLCACVILLPPLPPPVSLLLQLTVAALMCAVAFPWQGWRTYFRRTFLLFVLSALFAGVALALFTLAAPAGLFVSNGTVYYDIPPLWLAALCGASYLAVCLFDRLLRRRLPQGGLYRLTVTDAGGTVTLSALFDSGNRLRETFSGFPVIVVQREAVLPVLSETMRETLALFDPAAPAPATPTATGWRLIPFSSVGGSGLLPAFLPTTLLIQRDNDPPRPLTACYLALSPALGRGDYTALIGAEALAADQETQKGEPYEMAT